MLSFGVFLLATSALVGAAVLPQRGSDVDKPTTYKPDSFGRNVDIVYPARDEGVVPKRVVPVVSHLPVQQQFQHQSVSRNVPVQPVQNVFLRQQQPVHQQQPYVRQVQPVVPGLRGGPVSYHQVSVVPKSGVVEQDVVQPQRPVEVEPKHHAIGHDILADDVVVPTQMVSARILKQHMDVSPDGSFVNDWNSDNGISVHERGVVKHVGDVDVAVQSGEVSYVDNEGRTISWKYVADEAGFHVEGDHLPTPPPIPEAILRGLKYIEEHPYVETTTLPQELYQQEKQEQPGQQYQPGQQEQQYQSGQSGTTVPAGTTTGTAGTTTVPADTTAGTTGTGWTTGRFR